MFLVCCTALALAALWPGVSAQRCLGGEQENLAGGANWNSRGLLGRYYPFTTWNSSETLTWQPSLSRLHFDRVDSTIDTYWDANGLGCGVRDFGPVGGDLETRMALRDEITMSWAGRLIVPCTGEYVFRVKSDHGSTFTLGKDILIQSVQQPEVQEKFATVSLCAGESVPIALEYYQTYATALVQLSWKPPGAIDFEVIPKEYLVPSAGRSIIAIPSVLKLTPDVGVQEVCLHLSEKPPREVSVSISNEIGGDIFGFDACKVTFNENDWETAKCVKAALKPLALSTRSLDGVVPIMLEIENASAEYNPRGLIQAYNPSPGTENQPNFCYLWGQAHLTTFDKEEITMAQPGFYTVARDCSKDFVVQAFLGPCQNGAGPLCATHVYIKYRESVFAFSRNEADKSDTRPQGGLLTSLGSDVQYLESERFASVKTPVASVTVEISALGNGQFINIYIYASQALNGRMFGVCGNNNGNAADDISDVAQILTLYQAQDSEGIWLGNAANIVPLSQAQCGGALYPSLPEVAANMTFDPVCSGGSLMSAVMPSQATLPASPIVPPAYQPLDPVTGCTQAVEDSCASIIDMTLCPEVPQSNIFFLQRGCVSDACANGGPFDINNPPPGIVLPYYKSCETIDYKKCRLCTSSQACLRGECVDVAKPCLGACQNGATCANDICQCTAGYSGIYCEIAPETINTCPAQQCPAGTTCEKTATAACNCVDIDECVTGQHSCSIDWQCVNTEGSFTCTCKEGTQETNGQCLVVPPVAVAGQVSGTVYLISSPQDPLSVGIANLSVQLLSDSNVVATAVTDQSGQFTMGNIALGNYTIQYDSTAGYVPVLDPDSIIDGKASVAVTGNATNSVIFGAKKVLAAGTGIIQSTAYMSKGGRVISAYIPNVTMTLKDMNDNIIATGQTDAQGKYIFGNLGPGMYNVEMQTPKQTKILYQTDNGLDGTIAVEAKNGVTQQIYFVVTELKSPITGTVYLDAEGDGPQNDVDGIIDVPIILRDSAGSVAGQTLTNREGYFYFEVARPGQYSVTVTPPGGYDVSYDQDSTNDGTTSVTMVGYEVAVKFGLKRMQSAGNTQPVKGKVILDRTNNGKTADDTGISQVKVTLVNNLGTIVGSTFTDTDGNFEFKNVTEGQYMVRVSVPSGAILTYPRGTTNNELPVTVNSRFQSPELLFLLYFGPVRN